MKKKEIDTIKSQIKAKNRQAAAIKSAPERKQAKLELKQDPLHNSLRSSEHEMGVLKKEVSKAVVELKMSSYQDNPDKLRNISQEYALNKMCKIANKAGMASSERSSMMSSDISDETMTERTSATSGRTKSSNGSKSDRSSRSSRRYR